MVAGKEGKSNEKNVLSVSLRIAKEKERIVVECFKILKIASMKTNQKLDEKGIINKIYKEVKNIDNEEIKQLLCVNNKDKEEAENKIIKKVINSLN